MLRFYKYVWNGFDRLHQKTGFQKTLRQLGISLRLVEHVLSKIK